MNKTASVITVSDRSFRREREDLSGPAVAQMLRDAGFTIKSTQVLPDDQKQISSALRLCADRDHVSLAVTTGGTGVAKRDLTPEATMAICDKIIPGVAEVMRSEGLKKTPMSPLSRAVCGIRGSTLILNLPGSPSGAVESLSAVMPLLQHAIELLAGNTEH
ncbi:molybdopterin adenylyltransferase [Candidatus Koribacter versatilis Ellin345]|uniref:Molybdopterin adenylyltransferase n=1 Tax=Koribacter versatilis (strain Ellin345) TaxID=204669 RepID=Q1IHK1_KORVE|nr:MogA/MoaB family molybdenum cofactor biosynthesis protein [Candidatus Koribacter versatilis]ABF43649.1 molybdopterin adenylyltransferase [Candidatus Koribacter versatilis Ellin345]